MQARKTSSKDHFVVEVVTVTLEYICDSDWLNFALTAVNFTTF